MAKSSRLRRIFLGIITLLLLVTLSLIVYFQATRYPALPESSACWIDNPQARITRDRVSFVPPDSSASVGVIIYPGGNVDYLAYAPLAGRISAGKYPVFVQKMPLDLAVFGIRSAKKIMDDYPTIEKWVMVGHSLGGAMAARFALENEAQVQGLVFLAAYPDINLSTSGLVVLSLLGDRDRVINLPRFTQSQLLLPANADIRTLSGGNHAGFAHYGPQRGDGAAYINRDQQQNIAADAIQVLLETLENESEPQ